MLTYLHILSSRSSLKLQKKTSKFLDPLFLYVIVLVTIYNYVLTMYILFLKRESLKNLGSNHILVSQIVMVCLCIMQRKPKTDLLKWVHIESDLQIPETHFQCQYSILGCFGQSGLQKKIVCYFWGQFFMFSWAENIFLKYPTICTETLHDKELWKVAIFVQKIIKD